MMAGAPMLRGIYKSTEETSDTFRGGVPTFNSKAECKAWMEAHSLQGSNPDHPHLQHIFTHLVDWGQVERFLLPKFDSYRLGGEEGVKMAREAASVDLSANCYAQAKANGASATECTPVVEELLRRLELRFHRETNSESSLNTLRYLFYHMRCGIFVCIRGGEIVLFVPFVNRDYRNTWGSRIRLEREFDAYYDEKREYCRRENILPDLSQWWANGNIICNEHHRPSESHTQWWGDHLLAPLKAMIERVCAEREIPDAEFFINKRDFPQLRANGNEPYDFIFDEDDVALPAEYHGLSFAPVLSFYCSPRFADVPIPTTEDWEGAEGRVFPPSFCRDSAGAVRGSHGKLKEPRDLYTDENFRKFYVPWEDKVDTAFFRGNATGGGTTAATNQRLRAAELSQAWGNVHDTGGVPLLDAGATTCVVIPFFSS